MTSAYCSICGNDWPEVGSCTGCGAAEGARAAGTGAAPVATARFAPHTEDDLGDVTRAAPVGTPSGPGTSASRHGAPGASPPVVQVNGSPSEASTAEVNEAASEPGAPRPDLPPPPASVVAPPPPRPDLPSPPGGPEEEPGLGKLLATLVGLKVADLALWLAPVVVLGAIGLLLVSVGTSETTGSWGATETEIEPVGWVGTAFLCLAAAAFFGRGTFRSIGRLFRGEAGIVDALFASSNLLWALFTIGAVLAAGLCLALAVTGG